MGVYEESGIRTASWAQGYYMNECIQDAWQAYFPGGDNSASKKEKLTCLGGGVSRQNV